MNKFFIKWSRYIVFVAVFSFFINLLYLTFPFYMLAIYDRVLSSYSMPTLMTITAAALFALVIQGCLDFIRSRLLVLAGVDMDKSLSRPVFGEMLKDACRIQKIGYSQGLRDVNILRNYFGGSSVFALFDIPWTPIYLLMIYYMHPVMGYVAMGGAVATILLGLAQEMLTKKRLDKSNAINAAAGSFTGLCLRNSESIQAMGMLSGVQNRWQFMNDEVVNLQTRASRAAGLLQAISKTISASMQVFIYGVGAYLTLNGECTAGVMISSSIIMGRALAPVQQGMSTWKQTVDARGAYKRLNALINAANTNTPMDLPDPMGRLDVEGATLALNGNYLLKNISFSLAPGESLGLIGPSAAGKTTLCRLLLGIWPSMGGKVRLDGSDVFLWKQEHLGRFMGYLPQDVELFPGTICQNIARMGEPEPEEAILAAKKAGLHELILHLPQGYDTPIGPNAQVLSGGQRQRVGLARALYKSPKFVVLDEPNSNLDDVGERALLQALQILKKEKCTVIMVTHKPAMLAGVDKILVLQAGQAVRFGPRQEVLQAIMGVPSMPGIKPVPQQQKEAGK